MKNTILVLLLVSFFYANIFAQQDYLEIRKAKERSCDNHTNEALKSDSILFSEISEENITQGKKEFYYDKGMHHYTKYAKKKTEEEFEKSKFYFEKCLEFPESNGANWNLALLHFFHKDCEVTLKYLDLYVENEAKIDDETKNQIQAIRKNCQN